MRTPIAFGGPARGLVAWAAIVLTVSGGLVLDPSPAAAADPQAQGRKHSRRAAQLAAANKCGAAIVEYGKALALMKDPVLLFNRGECYRRLDENDKALADYRLFLQEMPQAPNRAQVTARIAEIEQTAAKVPPPAPPEVVVVPSPLPAPVPPPGAAPVAVAPPQAREDRPLAPGEGGGAAAPSLAPRFGEPQITMVDGDARPARDSGGSIADRWWFWAAVGTVLVAGGIATYFVVRPENEVPSTRLGNYPF